MSWSAVLSGAAPRAMRTAAGRRALEVALLVGGVFLLGLLCGERAQAADGAPPALPHVPLPAATAGAVASAAVNAVRAAPPGGDAGRAARPDTPGGSRGSDAAAPGADVHHPGHPQVTADGSTDGSTDPATGPAITGPAVTGARTGPHPVAADRTLSADGSVARPTGGRTVRPAGTPADAVPGESAGTPERLSVLSGPPGVTRPTQLALPEPTRPGLPALPGAARPGLPGVTRSVLSASLPELTRPGLPGVRRPGLPELILTVLSDPAQSRPLPDLPGMPGVPGHTLPAPGAPAPGPTFPAPRPEAPAASPSPSADASVPVIGRPADTATPLVHGPEAAGAGARDGGGGRRAPGGVVQQRGQVPAPHAPAGQPDGTAGNRSLADNPTPRHGDAHAVTPYHRPPYRLVPGAAERAEATGTRDRYRDVPVSPV